MSTFTNTCDVVHALLAPPSCMSTFTLTRDVVDALLPLLHAGHIVLQGGHVFATLGGLEAQQLGQLCAVLQACKQVEGAIPLSG